MLVRMLIEGFGQLELNNASFRRSGNVEAQCKLDETVFVESPCENGMLLVVDKPAKRIKLYDPEKAYLPVAINYSTEHMYDERATGLKYHFLTAGTFLPRMGYPAVGDILTTNTIAYDTDNFEDDDALKEAIANIDETPLFGQPCANGAIEIVETPTNETNVLFQVVKGATMPDGQYGVKFIAIKPFLADTENIGD